MPPVHKKSRTLGPSTIAATADAAAGRLQIQLAEESMGALLSIRTRYAADKPFEGLRIGINLHVTKETAVLVETLTAGGALCAVTGCNAFSTNDDVAAALAQRDRTVVHARHGWGKDDFYAGLRSTIAFGPDVIIDDGCDLTVELHKPENSEALAAVAGACEQTTSGVLRARNMAADSALRINVVATNDNKTKHLLDNYFGTGQSVWDGVMRASATFVAGKTAVVVGFGHCGKGIALRARGLGAKVIVCETDPFAALQAAYDGYEVMPMDKAAPLGDVFITATGSKSVVTLAHARTMKNGAMLGNAGQFPIEIQVEEIRAAAKAIRAVRPNFERVELDAGRYIYLLGGGNLVNLSCAEGHPSEVMATSFCGQALAVEHILGLPRAEEGKGCVVDLPAELDSQIASLQLEAMGIRHDTVTDEQARYNLSWAEGY